MTTRRRLAYNSRLTAYLGRAVAGLLGLALALALSLAAVHADDSTLARPAITELKDAALAPGRHEFAFQAGWRSTGDRLDVPVVVLKGTADGPRLLLTAAIHGDELNGIAVIHRLAERLEPAQVSGTLIMVPGVNRTGLEVGNRHFVAATGGGTQTDLNRIMPGRADGTPAERFAAALWDGLFNIGADFAVDLHTQTRGLEYPVFVFADFRQEAVREAAHILLPDIIKNDKGEPGSLETTLMQVGVPAVTFELGAPGRFQPEIIARGVAGIENLMRHLGMIAGPVVAADTAPAIGDQTVNIRAKVGGIAEIMVAPRQRVRRGETLAILNDAFGQEIERYRAPRDGIVVAISTDPLREAGSLLVRLLF